MWPQESILQIHCSTTSTTTWWVRCTWEKFDIEVDLLLLLFLLLQGPTMPTQQSNTGVKVAPLLNRPHPLPHRVTTPSRHIQHSCWPTPPTICPRWWWTVAVSSPHPPFLTLNNSLRGYRYSYTTHYLRVSCTRPPGQNLSLVEDWTVTISFTLSHKWHTLPQLFTNLCHHEQPLYSVYDRYCVCSTWCYVDSTHTLLQSFSVTCVNLFLHSCFPVPGLLQSHSHQFLFFVMMLYTSLTIINVCLSDACVIIVALRAMVGFLVPLVLPGPGIA